RPGAERGPVGAARGAARPPRRISWRSGLSSATMAATPDWTSSISTSAELLSGLFGDGTDRCPKCRKELTDSVRAHLYSCTMLPAEERRQAQEILTASRKLVKQGGQLREAEVAVALLRDAMKQSASEALRRMIHGKLRDGSLPNDGIQATIPGRPGDGSICGACPHRRELRLD